MNVYSYYYSKQLEEPMKYEEIWLRYCYHSQGRRVECSTERC